MEKREPSAQPETWSPDTLRAYLDHHHPDDYQLIDVRQLRDYGEDHLPGALWIPSDTLAQEAAQLDPHKTTVIYCSHGALSGAAARILANAGFRDVHALAGGMHAWQHGTATGLPQHACAPLMNAGNAQQRAVLAWHMEDAARRFYAEMAVSVEDPGVAALFAELAEAENHHKMMLKEIWEAFAGRRADENFPEPSSAGSGLIEGGGTLEETLAWAARNSAAEILDFAMALELTAYDHYLYMQRNARDPDSQRLYEVLADEERYHLRALSESLAKLQVLG